MPDMKREFIALVAARRPVARAQGKPARAAAVDSGDRISHQRGSGCLRGAVGGAAAGGSISFVRSYWEGVCF